MKMPVYFYQGDIFNMFYLTNSPKSKDIQFLINQLIYCSSFTFAL